MRTALLVPVAALTLAGCGGASSGNSATSSTTTTTSTTTVPSAASLGIKPGRWENKVETLDIQMEGMPPAQMAAIRKASTGHADTVISCLTPDQAAHGPSAAMLDKMHCHFDKDDHGGGNISTAMRCDFPTGTLTATGEGTYTPTSYSVEGTGSMTGRMKMTMHTRTSGRWLGECDGTEVGAKRKK